MCGLVAIINRHRQCVDGALLKEMGSLLNHRGPDDEGMFVSGAVGMFHKRLSIIDLSTGHQPMTVDGVTVVFNGEIYNYLELKAELQNRGHRFLTTSDTEVLVRMYLEYDEDFLRFLNGMYAFVLFDARLSKVLVARDQFGIKPLYQYETPDLFIYASEIKALLRHPLVMANVNEGALQDYLTLQFVLGRETLFRGIVKVMPAHGQAIDLSTGNIRTWRYWEPSFCQDQIRSEAEFVDELFEVIGDSVRKQMRSDVPVGAYLSGGLDSSVVAVLAARQSGGGFKTFTGAFREGPEYDESPYALSVANHCGADGFVIFPTETDFISLIPKLVYQMDEPAAGPGLFPQFMVSRLAAREVRVCLGGQGGDEIFGGYVRYLIACLEEALKGAILGEQEWSDRALDIKAIVPNLRALRQYLPMLTKFFKEGMFEPFDRRYFQLIDRSEGVLEAYSEEFRGRYDRGSVFERFREIFNRPDTKSSYNKMTYFDLSASLPALLQVEDRVSMAVSLESRVPLLDYRIVDLVARVPPGIKFKGGAMKYLFKRAVEGLLPENVFNRGDKMGFPVPLHLWAKGKTREFFHDILLSKACRERGLFNAEFVEHFMQREGAFSRVLWGLLQVELWHQQFIDQPPAAVE